MSRRDDAVSAPEHLNEGHDVSAFDSGVPLLDEWLKKRALANEERGASRTYVVTAGGRVVGYYALATGAVSAQQATGRIRRNMPDPIPVMILGRLAVDKAFQSKGLGAALLRDSVLRTRQAADIVGVRAMLVHAISAEAKRFYQRYGFTESPVDPMTLMLSLSDVDRIGTEK
jgi:GNAT superfamily N-acetyltransferase